MTSLMLNKQEYIIPFKKWLLVKRLYIIAYLVIILGEFCWFKWWYPLPNFFPNSDSFLEAAFYKQSINMWPIGYSWFLRVFDFFTHYDKALVLLQYLLLQGGLLWFFGTVIYMFKPGRYITIILLLFGLVNPLLLTIANFVSSDSLIAALSIIWLTQLCWTLYKPARSLLVLHVLVLLVIFTMQYNGWYYPLISIGVITFANISLRIRILGISIILLSIGGFIGYTMYTYKQQTGYWQFSALGGWQRAANVLQPYTYVRELDAKEVPTKFRKLHEKVNEHNESFGDREGRADRYLNTYYMWDYLSPLMEYFFSQGETKGTDEYFRLWAKQAPLYNAYGVYLMKKYPLAYARYYLWPNLVRYYVPKAEYLEFYNGRADILSPMAVRWFKYSSNKAYTRSADKHNRFMFVYTYVQTAANMLFVLGFTGFILLGGLKYLQPYKRHIVWWIIVVWTCNLIFNVTGPPMELRYLVFSMLITFPFGILWFSFVIKESLAKHKQDELRDNATSLSSIC